MGTVMNFLPRPALFRLFLVIMIAGVGTAGTLAAATRTFTDRQGRTIQAEFVSLENGVVKIRRDDGITFDLQLSSLSDADQKWIRDEAARPAALPATALAVEMVRSTYSTEKDEKTRPGLVLTLEQSGYRVKITNKTAAPLSLTAKYRVFVQNDTGSSNQATEGGIRKTEGQEEITGLPPYKTTEFRTNPIPLGSQKLKPGYAWKDSKKPREKIADEIIGIQLRVYAGDQLVVERHVPPSLEKTQPW
ncbi:hypothetical protein OPIT5_03690 [Opitutaceae bacterium TAV5]|nr:hypothetical protein OPIT5_03690 [Opitutaceae bacterium TAV5]